MVPASRNCHVRTQSTLPLVVLLGLGHDRQGVFRIDTHFNTMPNALPAISTHLRDDRRIGVSLICRDVQGRQMGFAKARLSAASDPCLIDPKSSTAANVRGR